ncbi:hypothetical protein C8R43DRAFT_952860 [Mycena crocata]|nr:hypothetical protein C8R43DRAFT_952860 [Mycena crocata]
MVSLHVLPPASGNFSGFDIGIRHIAWEGPKRSMEMGDTAIDEGRIRPPWIHQTSGLLELATLLVKQLSVLLGAQPGESEKYPLAVAFIQKTENNPALSDALLQKGVVPRLTAVISKMALIPEAEPMLITAVQTFMVKLRAPPGYPWMVQALNAGLFKLLLLSESLPTRIQWLQKELRSATVSHTELRTATHTYTDLPIATQSLPLRSSGWQPNLSLSLEGAGTRRAGVSYTRRRHTTGICSRISGFPLLTQWRQFVSLAAEYIRVLRDYQSGEHEKLQICNNDDCLNVTAKDVTRRCSV